MSGAALLDERYAAIAAAKPQQQAAYERWLGGVDTASLTAQAAALGIDLDVRRGTISYSADFEAKRLPLEFDLMYVRHGKTTGNTEPRVYQGHVDDPSNALNEIGLAQAEEAADKLDALGLSPDLVVLSPLSRAEQTGLAYVKRHTEFAARTELWEDTAEMRFGGWDNVKVKDLEDTNICHLFYLAQNALVKSSAPYVAPAGSRLAAGTTLESESFVEVLVRMHAVLVKLNARAAALRAGGVGQPLIVMYGHSMAGAALGVLTGQGKQVEGESFLGFDGKYILPNATPCFFHKIKKA
jgi:broad specificity phosphatase PhoE